MPVGDWSLFSTAKFLGEAVEQGNTGRRLYNMLLQYGECFELTANMRMDQTAQHHEEFSRLVECAFNAEKPNLSDLKFLEARVDPTNKDEFKGAILISPWKSICQQYNIDRLLDIGNPIIPITAQQSADALDSAFTSERHIYLCEGADVMLTDNINKNYGIINSRTGTVRAIIEEKGTPEYLIIDLHSSDYHSPIPLQKCFNGIPDRIVIRRKNKFVDSQYRKQFPVIPAYGITAHKV